MYLKLPEFPAFLIAIRVLKRDFVECVSLAMRPKILDKMAPSILVGPPTRASRGYGFIILWGIRTHQD